MVNMVITQLDSARAGIITPEMEEVARTEGIEIAKLSSLIGSGLVVIPANINHSNLVPIGIGSNLRIKVNSNIGTSQNRCSIDDELAKVTASINVGADTVMDLSTAGDLDEIRKAVLDLSTVPVGTVPIYQMMVEKDDAGEVTGDDMIEAIRIHAEQGVDFVTVHCGVTLASIPLLESRLLGVVSRGGSFLVSWMNMHGKENPLYERYDEILEIAREFDVTLSLGDGLRPGCIHDATDQAQLHELRVLGELVQRARKAGVQVMVEGPGHVPLDEIEKNVKLEKEICCGAPFYVLGPLVTDVAAGYDHIAGAIGGALAGYFGADFLCYVTPAEHLKLPELEDVREGVIASRIAAHAADMARNLPGARDWDRRMSTARARLDWDAQIREGMDPEKSERYRRESSIGKDDVCTMCGKYCAIKLHRAKLLKADKGY